jgi:hypothetical protein
MSVNPGINSYLRSRVKAVTNVMQCHRLIENSLGDRQRSAGAQYTYGASQTCIVCPLTPQSHATSVTVRPSAITARIALYFCSATLISLMYGSVKHQPK